MRPRRSPPDRRCRVSCPRPASWPAPCSACPVAAATPGPGPQVVGRLGDVRQEGHPGHGHVVAEVAGELVGIRGAAQVLEQRGVDDVADLVVGAAHHPARRAATTQRRSDSSMGAPVPRSVATDRPPSSPSSRNTPPPWHPGGTRTTAQRQGRRRTSRATVRCRWWGLTVGVCVPRRPPAHRGPVQGRVRLQPAGDQPAAIAELTRRINAGEDVVLLGATGTGKSATTAWLIEQVQRPTLVMAPNKTLAAQLANEFRELLPNNAVEYFVSYYDYYQPEATSRRRTPTSRRTPRSTTRSSGCATARPTHC